MKRWFAAKSFMFFSLWNSFWGKMSPCPQINLIQSRDFLLLEGMTTTLQAILLNKIRPTFNDPFISFIRGIFHSYYHKALTKTKSASLRWYRTDRVSIWPICSLITYYARKLVKAPPWFSSFIFSYLICPLLTIAQPVYRWSSFTDFKQ